MQKPRVLPLPKLGFKPPDDSLLFFCINDASIKCDCHYIVPT